jgi:type IV pilus assembly protein PilA
MRINKNGFSLIELLVVVAILGILALIALVQYSSYRNKAADSAALSDLKTIQITAESYYASHHHYPH